MLRVSVIMFLGTLAFLATGYAEQTNNDSAVQEEEAPDLWKGPKDEQQTLEPGKIDEDAKPMFLTTESGLKYRILRKGNAKKKPTAEDNVKVHYKGWLDNNSVFDSSYREGEPVEFPLNRVVKGWTEGLQLVGKGGMIELVIPAKLGYGERGGGPIPPNSTLHFLVELLEIN